MRRQMARLSCSLLAAIGCTVLMVSFSPAAQAYQTVKVGSSGATVFANPKSDSETVGSLSANQVVNIGDQPRDGYYRATAAGGVSGWVPEDALVLPGGASQASHASAPSSSYSNSKSGGDERKFYVGGTVGAGIAGGGASLAFGAEAGYKITSQWGLGLYYEYLGLATASTATGATSTTTTTTSTTPSIGANVMFFAGEINYYIPPVKGLHVGIKGGVAVASVSATNIPTNTTGTTTTTTTAATSSVAIAGAAALGYDLAVLPLLSIGAEANIFLIGGTVSSTVINTLAVLKFTF